MKLSDVQPGELYNSKQVANILDVNNDTVNRWCKEGRLEAVKLRGWKILGENIYKMAGSTTENNQSDVKKVDTQGAANTPK